MKYEIVSDRPCFIDVVGELKPNEPRVVDNVACDLFRVIHGYPIGKAQFPNFVQLTYLLTDDEESE